VTAGPSTCRGSLPQRYAPSNLSPRTLCATDAPARARGTAQGRPLSRRDVPSIPTGSPLLAVSNIPPVRDEPASLRVLSVADLSGRSRTQLLSDFCHELRVSEVAFINAAKIFIALGGDTEANRKAIKGKGVSSSSLKNAIQAVEVWEAVVVLGYADEAWFDQQTYGSFVLLNRAIKKAVADGLKGADHLKAAGVFAKKRHLATLWCEEFTSPAPVKAAPPPVKAEVPSLDVEEPAAPKEAVPAVSAPPAEEPAPVTSEAPKEAVPAAPEAVSSPAAPATPIESVTVTEPKAATPPVEGKPEEKDKKTSAPQSAELAALSAIEKAERAIVAFVDTFDQVSAERVISRLLAAKLAVESARDRRFPAVNLQSLKSLERHVTAAA
jgi:hypothetical protein